MEVAYPCECPVPNPGFDKSSDQEYCLTCGGLIETGYE